MITSEIAIILCTIGFIVLIAFLCSFFFFACTSIKKINSSLSLMNAQIEDLGHEPRNLIHNANALSEDLHKQLECLEPVFHSIADLGDVMEYKTARFKRDAHRKAMKESFSEEEGERHPAEDILHIVVSGLHLWKKYQK